MHTIGAAVSECNTGHWHSNQRDTLVTANLVPHQYGSPLAAYSFSFQAFLVQADFPSCAKEFGRLGGSSRDLPCQPINLGVGTHNPAWPSVDLRFFKLVSWRMAYVYTRYADVALPDSVRTRNIGGY